MTPRAVIFGCEGLSLSDWERDFFKESDPLGFILFARNCDNPHQVEALTASLRDAVSRDDAPILIDQEGGRVARLKPPRWRAAPAARRFGDLAATSYESAIEAVRLNARLIGLDLIVLGIDVDCLPVLDVPKPGAHDVIGDRAFAEDPDLVSAMGNAVCSGLLEAGVLPVIKHMPGHGRAAADSHEELPVVAAPRADLETWDFQPFKALADAPWGMTAHVVYGAIDPDRPATTSPVVVSEVIRGFIGFDGFLVSDDLSMKALDGSFEKRTGDALAAGCDAVLHCNGKRPEMEAVATAAVSLSPEAERRLAAAAKRRSRGLGADPAEDRSQLAQRLDMLLQAV